MVKEEKLWNIRRFINQAKFHYWR